MNDAVHHRGPDAAGVTVIGNVGLGHQRLAIIDLSDRAGQPMCRDVHHISFNGQIYNYVELRCELESAGHHFTTASDTEVLLVALRHWGLGALDRLNGMFAFVYLDQRARRLYLVRDRFGKKPLVYSRLDDHFCVASEVKQILRIMPGAPKANLAAAMDFLTVGALNRTEATFFDGITEVPAGHLGCFDLEENSLRIERWYDLAAHVRNERAGYEVARETVRDLLTQSVRLRHRADVKVGACLSGGIDSSAIVSLSAGLKSREPLPTISSYAPLEGYDERPFSRAVVAAFGLPAIEICPDVGKIWEADTLEDICYHHDQPIVSGSHYNEYCVFQAAREAGITVMLDGQGADEYFGGYGEFWFSAQLEHLRQHRFAAFCEGIAARAEATSTRKNMTLRKFLLNLLGRKRAAGQHIGPYPFRWSKRQDTILRRAPEPRDFKALSLLEIQETSLPHQLHSEDRNSMRWSVESRLPFMDYRLIEYVLGLPTEYKVGKGFQKRVLRDAVPELPATIARRKDKIGFASPDASGLVGREDEVREQLEGTLANLDKLIDRDAITRAFDAMLADRTWYDGLFFRIVALGAWMRASQCSL